MRKFIVFLLLIVLGFCIYKAFPDAKSAIDAERTLGSVNEIVKENATEENLFSKEAWEKLKEKNENFVGYLEFDSKIISLPVVKSGDNDFYLRKSFDKNYNEQGIPFMDCNCNLDSTNITIYGHNVYYDTSAMFSPLSFFVNQESLDGNEVFRFYLEDEIRVYQITDVYYLDLSDEENIHNYLQTEFTGSKEFYEWYEYAHSRNLIQSNIQMRYGSKMITLQTCKKNDPNTRILVLAKQIQTLSY